MAGNQLGKTLCAGMEVAFHLTGLYPPWWDGKTFPGPNFWWAANTNNETTRDNPQRILFGPPGDFGTGTLPASCMLEKPTMNRGFADLIDTAYIKHRAGGRSVVQFKAYDQGRKKFQGSTLTGGAWCDEEPPADVYSEILARITSTSGIILLTMTPLLGMSDVVTYFFPEPNSSGRSLVQFEIEDAAHIDESDREAIVAGYPAHERDARARGYPMLGEGKVFPIPQTAFECKPFSVPNYWRQIGGLDFGYGDHPFAAVKCVIDPDTDTFYVTNEHKDTEPQPPMHIAAVKPWGEDLIFQWPHDGTRQWGDSGPVIDVYRSFGLKAHREHAHFKLKQDTGKTHISPEACVSVVLAAMQTGRFKVFASCDALLQEISTYHRKDGKLVQKKDDLISAVFKAIMMRRYARAPDVFTSKTRQPVITEWNELDHEDREGAYE